MEIMKFILQLYICIAVFRLSLNLVNSKSVISEKCNNIINGRLKRKSHGYFSYETISTMLRSHGVHFMFNSEVEPSSFFLCKLLIGVLLSLVGFKESSFLIAMILFSIGFYVPDFIIKISNDNDNEKMLVDIKSIYDTLRIQTKAGVHFKNALGECYLAVKNSRLKSALLGLNSSIIANQDIESALDDFSSQFKNEYIDTLCIIIEQSQENGQSVQILNDISNQIKDIQHAISLKEKARVDRKIQMMQFFIFVGVLAVCLYALGIELFASLMGF